MKKRILVIVLVLLVAFICVQAIRPKLDNPPVVAEIQAPDSVKAILQKACYDCHSNQTNLRWYDQVTPAYWKVVADVKEARAVMNFSDFAKLPKPDQQAKLWESLNQILAGAMPIGSYTAVHPSTKLSQDDIRVLKNYLLAGVKAPHFDVKADSAANQQFEHWKGQSAETGNVPVALNGLPFNPDYKNWQVLSTSERFDNGTMRLILGNAVAISAVKNHQIATWPDGAEFAKVTYAPKADQEGNVTTGEFKQVEFMLKDAAKYKSTGGWGFARFKTMKLVPYGKDVMFANECIRCHRPEAKTDFVFTQPIRLNQ